MVAMMVLSFVLMAQDPSAHHIRPTDPKIKRLFIDGLSRSPTFRSLVEALDRSDVIVYVDTKTTRPGLGAYLSHSITVAGAYRYVHIALDVQGARGRLVPLLAHELQHAAEVAAEPGARDLQGVDKLFERLAIPFGCGGTTCNETQAARDVEVAVRAELKLAH